jgi:hypothetical protein
MPNHNGVLFCLNQPERVAMKYAGGILKDWGYGDRVLYTLTDGRTMLLDTDTAAKIHLAEIQPGQEFWLCKRKGAGKNAKTRWDLYLEDPTPRHEETGLERDLRLSIHQAEQKQRTPPAPPTAPRPAPLKHTPAEVGNGHAQPIRQLAPAPQPQRLPWHDFMVEQANCLTDVYAAVLSHAREAHGEAVTPDVVQKLVTTTYIQHAKGGRG